MDERVVRFRVGVMVLATGFITAILVLLFGDFSSFGQSNYKVYIAFPQAPGVTRDTPVRKSGILIGRVSSVDFADQEQQDRGFNVIITAKINKGVELRENENCQVGSSILGGDAVLQFIPSGDRNRPKGLLGDGDVVAGVVTPDPLQVFSNLEGSLTEAIVSVARTSDEVGRLAGRLGDLLGNNDEQFTRIVNKTELTLDKIRSAVESTNEVLSDPMVKENLKRAVSDLPEVLQEMKTTISGVKNTLQLVDNNLKNVEGLTKPLGDRGTQIINNIENSTAKLDLVLSEMGNFSKKLNDSEGSLGQLLNNPDVYQQLNSAITNVNDITRQLKPIVRDVRVFTDKVSRHQGSILREALHPSSGIK
jgi:phospholipid/cholesterol/gamma-HCH transport system substrate-binding protein